MPEGLVEIFGKRKARRLTPGLNAAPYIKHATASLQHQILVSPRQMPQVTHQQRFDERVRVALHPYKRLCKMACDMFQQQAACNDMQEVQMLRKEGMKLFFSVALMHECPMRHGASACAMCEEAAAYGNRRPKDEIPDPYPLLSNAAFEVGGARDEDPQFKARLHPYRRVCKLIYEAFDQQKRCETLTDATSIATNTLSLFETEEPSTHACFPGNTVDSMSCLEDEAYGQCKPRPGL